MPTSSVLAAPVLHLTIIDGSVVHSLRVTEQVTRIGRDATNDLVLRDRYVSSHHAEIRNIAGRLCVQDLRSTNGTRVRRHRWLIAVDHSTAHQAWLEDGDEILLGQPSHEVVVRLSIVLPPSEIPDERSDADTAILESVSCSALPDVAERFGRNSLQAIQNLASRLKPKDEPSVLVEEFAKGLLDQLPKATHVTVHLLDETTGAYVPAIALTRSGAIPAQPLSRTLQRQVLSRGQGVIFTGNQSDSLQEASIQSGLCAPLCTADRIPGIVQVDRRGMPDGAFSRRDLGLLVVVAHEAALVLELSMMRAGIRETVEKAIGGVVAAMEARDEYMAGHSQAVAELSRRIAQRLALGASEVAIISRAAALHDLGRFGVPGEILNKPDQLTDEELRAVKAQPELGASLLERCGVLSDLVPIILHLHESWDGSGYPKGLAGNDIPLGARIVAVADAFHTIVSHRAHRQAMPQQAALAELSRAAGKRLDPRIVGVLEELIENANESWGKDLPTSIAWRIDASGELKAGD